jgi:isopenicillin N synthase-like dioxygenase
MNVQSVSFRTAEAPARFTQSLRETGFGVLTDHPVPAALVEAVFQEWADFFASESKARYTFDPKLQSGYFPFRSENAKGYPAKDLKEFFHLYPWTDLPAGMTSRTRELFERLSELAGTLLGWVEDHTPLEIRSTFSVPLRDSIARSQDILLRPIHYPPLTGGEEEGAIRAAAHEDINLITLLPAATAPGLEVLDNAGRWHAVPCDPGSIVVNNGDMLQMMTQGLYRSTTHRVVNPAGAGSRTSRYSMPLFLHPRPDVRLSEKHTAASYLRERLWEIGLLKQGESKSGNAAA